MPGDGELSCAELVELISDYVEGALTHDCNEQLEGHLRRCDGCDAYLDQLRRTIEVTGRLQTRDVPHEVASELLSAFRGWRADTG
jgi:anti-sigma factor RsiW